MKKIFYLLAFAICAQYNTFAAPGDTTWVQAQNDIWLDHFGDFNDSVGFPDGSKTYRKIYMVFTLGKYQCPGNPQYCGDWDYTVENYLLGKNGDTVELGRFITPYANASYPRTPWGWTQRYIFDVTDYYTLLRDTNVFRIHYSGYSWGFTANVKFAFIEGTPARDVVGVDRLWHGSFRYGDATNPIEAKVDQRTLTAPAGTQTAEMKFNITGHGADNSGCSEFCKKYYQVKLNGSQIAQKDIWRDDCGYNHMYPQSGTWVYDRGNWCPGDLVHTNTHVLTGVTANSSYDIDVDFEGHTSTSGNASYTVEGTVVYYGAFNHALDAELTDVIAPTDFEGHFRENPTANRPLIKVTNQGSTPLTSMKIDYGVTGYTQASYTWSGTLNPLESTTISLPEPSGLNGNAGTKEFNAAIAEVNGQADEDATNDALTTNFQTAPMWPAKVAIQLRTNNAATETSWKILDKDGNVVHERIPAAANTTYNDTVTLSWGNYRFVVEDAGCDGLEWWANPNAGTGKIEVRDPEKSVLAGKIDLKGYFNADFGCGFTEHFRVGWPTSVNEVEKRTAIEVYPNPASENITVMLSGIKGVDGELTLIDATGRIVHSQPCHQTHNRINTARLAQGVYVLKYAGRDGNTQMHQRVVIAR